MGPLCGATHSTIVCFPERGRKEEKRGWGGGEGEEAGEEKKRLVFSNLILEATAHHFCYILLLRSGHSIQPIPDGGDSQGMNTRNQGSLEAAYHTCPLRFSCHLSSPLVYLAGISVK